MRSTIQVPKTNETMAGDSSLSTSGTASTSRSLPSIVDSNKGKDSVFMAAVTRMVNDVVFPLKQFIILEEEMDVQSRLATKCCKELKIEKSKWYQIKEIVRKRVTQKRNNVQSSVRKSLTSK